MTKIARLGIDTSKSIFQLHGVDDQEEMVLQKKLRRRQLLSFVGQLEPCLIGLEACGGSHHWARELKALGHQVVLLPPQYVRPYVTRNKNDKNDAEAICEAMDRPKLKGRFVPVKSAEQQAAQMLLGTREDAIKRRTQLSNQIRGYAAEFGVVAAKGLCQLGPLLARLASDDAIPALAKQMFVKLAQELAELGPHIAELDKQLQTWQRSNELCRRLREVPTIGPVGAGLLAIKVGHPAAFRSGRACAAWVGLTPKDHSTAGKQRLGGITRAGDEGLRAVLVSGATAYIQQVRRGRTTPSPWLADLLRRKPLKLAAVALANKTARIAWKLMVSGERYEARRACGQQRLGAAQWGRLRAEPLRRTSNAAHGADAMSTLRSSA